MVDVEKILELRRSGLSYEKIGKKFHKTHKTIKKICVENGLDHIDYRYGENNVNWNGGARIVDHNGYVNVYLPQDHPFFEQMKTKRGLIMEHRLVMAEHLGRPLEPDENVHHIDGNKQNNNIENLELWVKSQPNGVRVDDAVKHALEIIKRYRPELLVV